MIRHISYLIIAHGAMNQQDTKIHLVRVKNSVILYSVIQIDKWKKHNVYHTFEVSLLFIVGKKYFFLLNAKICFLLIYEMGCYTEYKIYTKKTNYSIDINFYWHIMLDLIKKIDWIILLKLNGLKKSLYNMILSSFLLISQNSYLIAKKKLYNPWLYS
jgi:hypothetical protein